MGIDSKIERTFITVNVQSIFIYEPINEFGLKFTVRKLFIIIHLLLTPFVIFYDLPEKKNIISCRNIICFC